MRKKVVLCAMVLVIIIGLVSCGQKDCKAKDCSDQAYKDGLCEMHYFEKTLEDGMKELEKMFD